MILLLVLRLPLDIILHSKRPTRVVSYPNYVRRILKRLLFVGVGRVDNQSIKLKIMCNYITNQQDFAYLVKTRVLSHKIGNWLESGSLKRLVQYSFVAFSSKAS